MEAWIGLVGALFGGVLALVGQQISSGREARAARSAELLDQLSLLIALSEDYRNRVWEERRGLNEDAVAQWDFSAYRRAQARLKLLVSDQKAIDELIRLQEAGQDLGKRWRLNRDEGEDLEGAWREHREALDAFIGTARGLVGRAAAARL